MLNEFEKNKLSIISKLVSKEISTKEAVKLLNLTERQIYRLKKIYVKKGDNGFIHKNRGKENHNKKDEKLINELEELYLNEYYDYNFEQFYEDVIYENYDVSYDCMLKRFTKDDIISPLAHKKTIKEYKEKMSEVIKEDNSSNKANKTKLFKSRIIQVEKAHTRRSSNLYVFG